MLGMIFCPFSLPTFYVGKEDINTTHFLRTLNRKPAQSGVADKDPTFTYSTFASFILSADKQNQHTNILTKAITKKNT